MTDINSEKLKQLQAELEKIYQQGPPINEIGSRVDLNEQVRSHLSLDKIAAGCSRWFGEYSSQRLMQFHDLL